MVDFSEIIGKGNMLTNEELKLHSYVGIGGRTELFAYPTNFFDLIKLVTKADQLNVPYKIIGNASNILFDDDGFFGIIISTKRIVSLTRIENDHVLVSSGTTLGELVLELRNMGLSGLEWSAGIPATVGGAVYMNASAFTKSMKDVVYAVTFFENGKLKTLKTDKLEFGYRKSYFKTHKTIIMSAELVLTNAKSKVIDENIKAYISKRRELQPQGRSLGSVFINAEKPAGYLIENVGLKGKTIGGATISTKHANFFINDGTATCLDYLSLIELAQDEVYKKYNIMLQKEIEYLPSGAKEDI